MAVPFERRQMLIHRRSCHAKALRNLIDSQTALVSEQELQQGALRDAEAGKKVSIRHAYSPFRDHIIKQIRIACNI
jgi:hypothetical protein